MFEVEVDVGEVVIVGVMGEVVEVVVVEVVDVEAGVVRVVVLNGSYSCTKLITIGRVAILSGITFSSIALIIIISVSVSGKAFKINSTELSLKFPNEYLPLKSSTNLYLGKTSGKSVSGSRHKQVWYTNVKHYKMYSQINLVLLVAFIWPGFVKVPVSFTCIIIELTLNSGGSLL